MLITIALCSEHQRELFSRSDSILNTLAAAGLLKSEQVVVRITVLQLPSNYETDNIISPC